jgi:hypothetical protein
MSKISELSDGGSLVSTDFLIAVRSGGNVKVKMDTINVDQVDLGDNEFIRLGNSQDLTLVHNASNSIINQAGIGDLLIQKAGTTKASFTTNGLEFPDSSKAIFGAGSDLQIYHDGNHSYLKDAGTGDLYIQGEANVRITDGDGNKMFLGQNDGEVQLYYNGAEKLNTTNTGIDVTGTVTADGLTVDGSAVVRSGNTLTLNRTDNAIGGAMSYVAGTGFIFNDANGDGTSFNVGAATKVRISGGNVGIGTTSPTVGKLQVNDGSGAIVAITRTSGATSGNLGVIRFGNTDVDSNLANITAIQDGSTTSSALTFETQSTGGATTERMRISGGNLALMTDGAEFQLYYTQPRKFISNSGASVTIKQIDNDAGSAYIDFAAWDNSSLMRLMNSGNLLVGTTSASTATQGIKLRNDLDAVAAQADGQPSGYFGRLNSDGDILNFNRGGTSVGSIGVNGDKIIFGTANAAIAIDQSSNIILPYNPATPGARDAAIDLGYASGRFKDLYLSGGAYLGGTAAANKLDDYEEGLWTLTITTSGTGESVSIGNTTGTYTKIGRQVTATIYTSGVNVSAAGSGALYLGGLPFTAGNGNEFYAVPSFGHTTLFSYQPDGYVAVNTNYIAVTRVGTTTRNDLAVGNPKYMMMTVTYFTA